MTWDAVYYKMPGAALIARYSHMAKLDLVNLIPSLATAKIKVDFSLFNGFILTSIHLFLIPFLRP